MIKKIAALKDPPTSNHRYMQTLATRPRPLDVSLTGLLRQRDRRTEEESVIEGR